MVFDEYNAGYSTDGNQFNDGISVGYSTDGSLNDVISDVDQVLSSGKHYTYTSSAGGYTHNAEFHLHEDTHKFSWVNEISDTNNNLVCKDYIEGKVNNFTHDNGYIQVSLSDIKLDCKYDLKCMEEWMEGRASMNSKVLPKKR
ncbi:hypothetical protein BIY23_03330 [Wolbachia pipientis]|uniref:Uncharacterized protein n=1 Tax=Wolbachia pipientis TaxID=955 RepID=A0A1E7QJC2_WOLPI|nr:hypothetical protein [Wolbachia pipientis]OEY86568.1 hypothetical protein BIY23_03330 [Wolbachia pipientis]